MTRQSCVQNQRVGEKPVHRFSVETKSVRFYRKESFSNATNAGNRSAACVIKEIEPRMSKNRLRLQNYGILGCLLEHLVSLKIVGGRQYFQCCLPLCCCWYFCAASVVSLSLLAALVCCLPLSGRKWSFWDLHEFSMLQQIWGKQAALLCTSFCLLALYVHQYLTPTSS